MVTASRPHATERITAIALTVAAVGFGYGITSIASRFDDRAPFVLVAIVLVPIFLVAVLVDAKVGAVGAFALIPIGTTKVGAVPAQLIIVAVAAFTVLVALRRLAASELPLAWSPILWWPASLVVWSMLGWPGAVDSGLAVRQIAQLAGGILMASLVVAAYRDRRDGRVVVAGFIGVSVIIALLAIAAGQDLHSTHGGAVVSGRAQGPFTQPNELGSFCAPMSLLAIAAAIGATRARVRWAAGAGALVLLLALALSLSRGAWIGLAIGGVVIVVMLPQARRALAWLAPTLLVVAMGMGSFAPTNPQVQVVGERLQSIAGEKNPYDARPAIWAEARREIRTRPLFGEGAGTFPVASATATSESRTTYAVHAHNIFLTWGAETGLPGMLLLIGLCAHVAVRASRARRAASPQLDAAILAGSTAALAAVIGQGLLDYTLRNSSIFIAVFAILGLQAASSRIALHR